MTRADSTQSRSLRGTGPKKEKNVVALGVEAAAEGVAGSTFNRQTIVRFLEP